MKTRVIFSVVITAVLYMGTAKAQFTPSTQRASLTGSDRAIVEQRINKYTAFTIDNQQLTDHLYDSGGAGQLAVCRRYIRQLWNDDKGINFMNF